MLTPLDDTLRHVLPTTFDHAGTSDPRFFDRYWFAVYDPAGTEPVLNTGMCSYLNMNVVDGYASMISEGTQHNQRLAGALRPQLFDSPAEVTTVGPLRMEVLEPFRRLRLQLDGGGSDMAFDLEWSATLPPARRAAQLHAGAGARHPGLPPLQPVGTGRRLDRAGRFTHRGA